MVLTLYMFDASPPVRAVLLVVKALDINVELKEINLLNKEQLIPEYLKLNPQHTVPTLQDDDLVIWDSHAIATYLTDKYGKNDDLYPKDLRRRTVVNQRLHFDSGILFPRLRNFVYPIVHLNQKEIHLEKLKEIKEGYEFMEKFLSTNTNYLAGDEVTVADFCCVSTVTALNLILPVSADKFPNLVKWLKQMQNLPYYDEVNQIGLNKIKNLLKSKLGEDYEDMIKTICSM